MKLAVNELLKDLQTESLQRVLWIDPENLYCFIIGVDDKDSLPFLKKVSEILDDIVTESMAKIKEDPHLHNLFREITETNKKRRDAAWDVIGAIVEREPDIYDKDMRGAMIQELMDTKKVTKMTIYKYLRRYFSVLKPQMPCSPTTISQAGMGRRRV